VTDNSAQFGGGAFDGTLNNCTVTDNSAIYGGGVYNGTLNDCTLTGNSAQYGGGTASGTLNNSIVYYNTASIAWDNHYFSTLNYSCTTPLPAGPGNFTNAPLFITTNGWSNLSPPIQLALH